MAELAPLLVRIQDELTAARRAQQKDEVLLLGTVLAEVRNRELDASAPLTDDDIIDVVRKAIKRRRESQQLYESGGRPELAAKEAAEATQLERYLPPAVNEDEIRAAVVAAIAGGAANIGAIMGKVMPQFRGRADGTVINAIAKSELASR